MNKDQKKEAVQNEKKFIKCLDASCNEAFDNYKNDLETFVWHHTFTAKQLAAFEADKVLVLSNFPLDSDDLRDLRIKMQLSIMGQKHDGALPFGGAQTELFYTEI